MFAQGIADNWGDLAYSAFGIFLLAVLWGINSANMRTAGLFMAFFASLLFAMGVKKLNTTYPQSCLMRKPSGCILENDMYEAGGALLVAAPIFILSIALLSFAVLAFFAKSDEKGEKD
jgi:hypothetical protein